MIQTEQVKNFLVALQTRIVAGLEASDGQSFGHESWQRPEGGGGITRILEGGTVFERAGVGFSHVLGATLPASATHSRQHIAGRRWEAMGVSLVVHPRNPYIPTVHLNVRYFVAYASNEGEQDTWWFGGGMDLTPYYTDDADVTHFHATCKKALTPFGAELHPRYKQWCDEYFYLKHRKEPRGVGGIFFDDLSEPGFEKSFAIQQATGNAFLEAYIPLVERHKNAIYGERERDFQLYRRGRYVEFNLVFDRGTLFGLQSGGRTESILMSMPPLVNWRYQWQPEPGSEEAKLYTHYLIAKDWV